MKLNMQILYDELRSYAGHAVLGDQTELDLYGVRLFSQTDTRLSPEYVYLCTSSDLRQIIVELGDVPLKFICAGELNLRSAAWQLIFIRGNLQPAEVFEDIQEIFEKYDVWDGRLAEAAMVPNNLQRLLDIGAQYLWNPIAITDLSWYDLARSGQFTSDPATWGSLGSGYANLGRSSDEELEETAQLLHANQGPFFTPSSQGNAQYLMAPINYEGTLYGVLKTNDMNQPITGGQMSLIAHIQRWIERTMAFSPIPLPLVGEDLAHADMMLDGIPVDPDYAAQALSRRGWRINDAYRLCAIQLYNGARIGEQRSYSYRTRLRDMFPQSIVFIREPYIILLRQGDPRTGVPAEGEAFCALLEQMKMRAGISMQFRNYLQLSPAFFQATSALEISERQGDMRPIANILSYYSDYVVSVLMRTKNLHAVCNEDLLTYAQQGGEKEREHLRSLLEYLYRGRNTSAAASARYIHRNTLRSHLEHIQRHTGIDLERLDRNTTLCLYLSCLVAERQLGEGDQDFSRRI